MSKIIGLFSLIGILIMCLFIMLACLPHADITTPMPKHDLHDAVIIVSPGHPTNEAEFNIMIIQGMR